MNHEELTLWLIWFAWIAILERLVFYERTVLVKFEFPDRLHVFLLLKIDLHELVFGYDVLFAVRASLWHIQCLSEADRQTFDFALVYLAFTSRVVHALLKAFHKNWRQNKLNDKMDVGEFHRSCQK